MIFKMKGVADTPLESHAHAKAEASENDAKNDYNIS